MAQSLMPVEAIGTRRTGLHRGGRQQKYVLDEVGRRLLLDRYDGRQEATDELMHMHFTPRGIPRWKVKAWACQLGLSRHKEPRWTEKELAYLERHLHKKSLDAIARHLGRTKVSIRLRAKRLGLNKCQEGYTMRSLMVGLGMTNHRRIAYWLDQGWIEGVRRHSDRSADDIWYFSDRAIREFVRNHPDEVDPRRADWLWLVDVLLGGEQGIGSLHGSHAKSEESE